MKKKVWHCKNCGNICDTSHGVCPGCGLDLGFYGEVQFVEDGTGGFAPPAPQPEKRAAPPPPKPEPKQEEPRAPKAEQRPAAEQKPKKKGKGVILAVVAVVVVVVLLAAAAVYWRMNTIVVQGIRLGELDWDQRSGVYYVESGGRATQDITLNYKGSIGSLPELTAASSDSDVVKPSINDMGDGQATVTLTAQSPGTAEITVRAGDERESYTIQVYEITGVKLEVPGLSDEISLDVGNYEIYYTELEYSGEIDEKYLPEVEVTSSDPDVVRVDPDSKQFYALTCGTAEITAKAGSHKKSVTVNVYEITKVELELYDLLVDGDGKTMYWLPQGLTMGVDFSYYYRGEPGSLPYYRLESSNENVISVDRENFTITAVGPGKATITVAMGGQTDSVTLDVYPVDRSSGAWAKATIDSIAAPAKGGTSQEDFKTIYTFGDGVSSIYCNIRYGAGGSRTFGDPENVSDQYPNASHTVYSRDWRITLKGSEWDQRRTIAGIVFLFDATGSETGYDPATDLIDYWVIYTK